MKSKLRAVYNRLGRPSLRRIAAVVGLIAATGLVAVVYLGDARLVASVALLMSLATIGAVAVLWMGDRKTRAEIRASNERTEVTFRRILAAIEVERLAAERRAAGIVPDQPRNR